MKQFYLPDTNILLTRFLCEGSVIEISDFMAIEDDPKHNILVRRVKEVRGRSEVEVRIAPQFDYARVSHTVVKKEGEYLFIPDKKELPTLRLRTDVLLEIEDGTLVGKILLHSGESMTFILEEAIESPSANPSYSTTAFKSTMNFWRKWIEKSTYKGRWRETVNRSALALKLLISQKHGSIVAAPTFGLPEHMGGVRNWDYRYTWIRDASFTLYALIRLGYSDEAGAFMNWFEKRCEELNPDGSMQIMYGLDGRKVLTEETLDHLEGYKGSKPVRIGNGAYNQLQLDIYGELMDSVYLYDKFGEPISIDLWFNLTKLINWVSANWNQKDEGIWEVRGGQQEFLFSRLMCWVALDRALRLARKRSFPAPFQKWFETRDEIYYDILKNFWNDDIKAFVQIKEGAHTDASALLMPMIKFIGAKDPRWTSTMQEITKSLVDDSLVHRYSICDAASDGLCGGEGTFNMCSFWYAECLSRAGDLQESRFLFEKMLGYANHLDLYSEELGASGEHLGNYPQAFTHLALISAAFDLDRRLDQR